MTVRGSLTKDEKKEIIGSWWIALTFVIFCNWIAFFWIGFRVKRMIWVLFGFIYLVICMVLPVTIFWFYDEESLVFNAVMWIFFVTWMISIVHASLCRRDYSRRRKVFLANMELDNIVYFEEKIKKAPGWNPAPQPYGSGAADTDTAAEKIDLNSATEQQLASLPGVSVAMAKRAADMRQVSEFLSVQDFIQRLGLMPHFAVQIEKVACAEPMSDRNSQEKVPGRVIDI